MKKTIVMMALAVGLTGFAAQNDKLISFYTNGPDTYADGSTVVDGECYALVWIKTGASFGGFNQDGSAAVPADSEVLQIAACAKDGKCNGVLFHVAAERDATYANTGAYQVYLMDTRDAAGVPSAVVDGKVACVNGCGLCPDVTAVVSTLAPRRVTASLTAAGIEAGVKFTAENVAYADNSVLLDGERVVLIGYPETSDKFHGIDWNFQAVMVGETVQVIGTTVGGKIDVEIPSALSAGYKYEVAVLDTRISPTELSGLAADGTSPALVCGWGPVVKTDAATSVDWTRVWIGNSGLFYHGITDAGQLINPVIFNFDPSEHLEAGKAAVYGLMGMQNAWFVFDLPKAYVTIKNDPQWLQWGAEKGSDKFYCALRPAARNDEKEFQLETEYNFKAYADETEKTVIHEALLVEKREGQPDVLKKAWKMGFDEVLATFTPMDPGVASGLREVSAEKAEIFRNWYQHNVPFFQWNCDFEISFDRDVKKDSFILAGYYAAAADYSCANPKDPSDYWDFSNWVGSSSYIDLPKGKHFRLLWDNDSASVTVNYQEICERVQEFRCGAYNLSSENWGTTMTVDLNIYENTGRHTETGSKITVGSYKYTFKGPLNVKFNASVEGNDPTGAVMPANLSTNTDGRTAFPLGVPTYDRATYKDITFVGWSNKVEMVTYAEIPTNTWATKESPIELYAVWKAAKSTKVTVKSAGETEKVESDIKVTKEWLDEKVGAGTSEKSDEVIQTALEQKVNTKSDLTYWQAYLLGIDPKDPNAELKVEKTNGQEDDKALVVSTVQVVAPDTGVKVGYSLDKVDADEKTVAKKGDEQETKDLKIDLEPEGETPTGYYKMNVIFTPTENGVEKADEKVSIPADNTIGVLKVETEEKVVPVAVPWKSLESYEKGVSVDELVKTSTLTEGDKMHVYDKDANAYRNYELENGTWQHVNSFKIDEKGVVTQTPAEDPTDETITRGSGVWLERQNTEKPIYLIGQYKDNDQASSTVDAPTEQSARGVEYNLIAPTGITDTDLNEVLPATEDKQVNAGDMIVVVRDGAPVRYRPTADGKWGYKKQVYELKDGRVRITTVDETKDTKVRAGLGMWYISAGGSPTINWPK